MAAFFLVIALIAPGGMGMGDVKLTGLIGLVLGALGLRYVAVAAGIAILLGGVAGLGALARRTGPQGCDPVRSVPRGRRDRRRCWWGSGSPRGTWAPSPERPASRPREPPKLVAPDV